MPEYVGYIKAHMPIGATVGPVNAPNPESALKKLLAAAKRGEYDVNFAEEMGHRFYGSDATFEGDVGDVEEADE